MRCGRGKRVDEEEEVGVSWLRIEKKLVRGIEVGGGREGGETCMVGGKKEGGVEVCCEGVGVG